MEKKTMGAFIATMRKAKGMTQLQLAERLGVSNKTISHWECDESAPDLSLLPELADILGITCDELLRGELNTIESISNVAMPDRADDEESEAKILKKEKLSAKISVAVSLILTVSGILLRFIIPQICYRIADDRVYYVSSIVSLLVGYTFFVAALIISVIALIKASNNISDFESKAAHDFKGTLYRFRFLVAVMFLVAVFLCTIPLYWNLILSGLSIVVGFLIYVFTVKKKGYSKDTALKREIRRNKKLFKKCVAITLSIVVVLAIGQIIINDLNVKPDFVFEEFEEFKNYMAEEVILYPDDYESMYPAEGQYPDCVDFDEEPLYTWVQNRDDVYSYYFQFAEDDNDGLQSIIVYRIPTVMEFEDTRTYINIAIVAAYIVVVAIGSIVYLKKRKKANCEE